MYLCLYWCVFYLFGSLHVRIMEDTLLESNKWNDNAESVQNILKIISDGGILILGSSSNFYITYEIELDSLWRWFQLILISGSRDTTV